MRLDSVVALTLTALGIEARLLWIPPSRNIRFLGLSNGRNAIATSIPLSSETSPGFTSLENAQLPATASSAINANNNCEDDHVVASSRSSKSLAPHGGSYNDDESNTSLSETLSDTVPTRNKDQKTQFTEDNIHITTSRDGALDIISEELTPQESSKNNGGTVVPCNGSFSGTMFTKTAAQHTQLLGSNSSHIISTTNSPDNSETGPNIPSETSEAVTSITSPGKSSITRTKVQLTTEDAEPSSDLKNESTGEAFTTSTSTSDLLSKSKTRTYKEPKAIRTTLITALKTTRVTETIDVTETAEITQTSTKSSFITKTNTKTIRPTPSPSTGISEDEFKCADRGKPFSMGEAQKNIEDFCDDLVSGDGLRKVNIYEMKEHDDMYISLKAEQEKLCPTIKDTLTDRVKGKKWCIFNFQEILGECDLDDSSIWMKKGGKKWNGCGEWLIHAKLD